MQILSGLGGFQESLTRQICLKYITMPGNTRHNLVDSIFSNKASPTGDIEKA